MNDLVYLSATKALRLFRARELFPVELMTAIIDHSETVEPKINTFSTQFFEEAIEKSKEAEKRYIDVSETPGPLEGLPIAIKEKHAIKGLPASEGSLIDKDKIADITHPVIERIFAVGGIMQARTTQPQYTVAGFAHSKMWGVTRNPWNLNCSPGGSSGRGTASLAAGTRLELTLTTYQTEAAQRLTEVIQKMLSDVGVAKTIQPLDKPIYDSALEAEEVEIALRVYTWDNADILLWFIHSQYIPTPNYTGVNNPDLDTCMDDADYNSATWAIRDEKYRVRQQYIINTHYPWAPVFQVPTLWFARDTVLDITSIALRAGMSTELWTLIDLSE